MPKTIAQLAIMNWIENHFGICNLDIKFTDSREAFVTDSNGDTLILKYDSDTRNVYAIWNKSFFLLYSGRYKNGDTDVADQ